MIAAIYRSCFKSNYLLRYFAYIKAMTSEPRLNFALRHVHLAGLLHISLFLLLVVGSSVIAGWFFSSPLLGAIVGVVGLLVVTGVLYRQWKSGERGSAIELLARVALCSVTAGATSFLLSTIALAITAVANQSSWQSAMFVPTLSQAASFGWLAGLLVFAGSLLSLATSERWHLYWKEPVMTGLRRGLFTGPLPLCANEE